MSAPPKQMRALVMDGAHEDIREAIRALRVTEIDVPSLSSGQLLVRIDSAPCNPADLLLLQGRYGITREFPGVPGLEGSGKVVAHGGGLLARWLQGRRVICGGHDASGTWAEYCAVDATSCLPLRRGLSLEQGATAVANPITAMALIDVAKSEGHRAAVQTAAAGQLGQMILALADQAGLPVIHIVRRRAQADTLRALGADHVLDSSAADFDDQLERRCSDLDATIAFDAVGGDMTGRLMSALPRRGNVLVYGALSGQPCGGLDPMELAFGDKRVRGFEVALWLKRAGLLRAFRLASRAQRLVAAGTVATSVQSRLSLGDAKDGLLAYVDNMSKGKVLVRPNDPS